MANGNYYLEQDIDNSGIVEVQNPAFAKKSYQAFNYKPKGMNVGDLFTKDSQYDEGLGDFMSELESGRNMEDVLADSQSTLDMWGNALVNNVVIAGTTAISGTLGLVNGLLEAASTGEADRIWNNSVNKWAVEQQEAVNKAFPIYRGKEYDNKSIFEKLGTGVFWAEVFKNAGFTEGMLIPGIGVARLLAGAPNVVRTLLPSFISSIGEGSIESINTYNDETRNKTALATQRYNELYSGVENEYQLEALNNEYLDTINSIEEDAKAAGNFVLGSNIALLTASNTLEFGKLFSRGFNTAKRVDNTFKRLGTGLRRTAEGTYEGLNVGKEVTKAVGKKLLDATSEGIEEVSQGIISKTPSVTTDYNTFNESMFNPEHRELATSIWQGLGNVFAESMGDSQTAEEFAMGFVTGLFGVPMLRKSKIPVTLENSIFGEITEARNKAKRSQDLASTINQRLSEDKEINAYYNGLVRHLALQDTMNKALDNDDNYEYKNAESAQFISDIMMFDEIGDINRLRELINNSVDTSDEGIQSIINETSKDGEGPFMQNGTPMNVEDVREILQRNIEELNARIDDYTKDKETYSRFNASLSDNALKALLFNRQQLRDHKKRIEDLSIDAFRGVKTLVESIPTDVKKKLAKGEGMYVTIEGKKKLVPKNSIDYFDENGNPVFIESTNASELGTQNEFLENWLTSPAYNKWVEGMLNSDKSSMTYDERKDLADKLKDLSKLINSLYTFNKNITNILTDPTKFERNLEKSIEKKAKVNEAINNVKKENDLNKKSVSEMNKDIDNGELDEEDLNSLFDAGASAEELSEVQAKAKEVVSIRNTDKAIRTEIAKDDGEFNQTKEDAAKLLDRSKEVAESNDEFLDLDSEAFNDPSLLYVEDDPTIQDIKANPEELQEVLDMRLANAKTYLSELISIIKANKGKLEDLPSDMPTTTPDSEVETTGDDAVEKSEPINVRTLNVKSNVAVNLIRDAIGGDDAPMAAKLRGVLNNIDSLVNSGADKQTIVNTIMTTDAYKELVNFVPALANEINTYTDEALSAKEVTTFTVEAEEEEESEEILTVEASNAEISNNSDEVKGDFANAYAGVYTSWFSPVTEFYRYATKGDYTTFDKVAETLGYTPEDLKRIKAIWNYLNNQGVFKYVNNGNVKVGDKLHFKTVKTLNEEAGEVVILLEDESNHIVGVLTSKNDKNIGRHPGLQPFIEQFEAAYEEAGSEDSFILEKDNEQVTTKVIHNMVGRPQFLAKDASYNTINVIANGKPFKLGISVGEGRNASILATPGRRKKAGKSALEKTIMSPVNAKMGMPYLLIETSDPNRAYLPVPFTMPKYSEATMNTALGRAIDDVLQQLVTMQAKDIMKVKRALQELLVLPEVHINFLEKSGNIKIDIKHVGDSKQTLLYNGKQDDPNMLDTIKKRLFGTSFQISRKYINDTYKGQDYNSMIGELANTNIAIGGLHTIDDWFEFNPIDAELNETEGKKTKSTRVNPNAAAPKVYTTNWKGIELTVNLSNYTVTDANGKTYTGKNADIVKARAYGFKLNKTGVYKTEWGWFDSNKDTFVDEPTKPIVQRRLGEEIKPEEPKPTEAKPVEQPESSVTSKPEVKAEPKSYTELAEEARKKGLISTPKRQALWQRLSGSQQEAILGKSVMKQRQLMDKLDQAFNMSTLTFDEMKLRGSVDTFLGNKPLNSRATEANPREKMRERELNWLSKVLPNLSSEERVKLVEGLIKISEEDGGGFAYGQFSQGVIYLGTSAARGTVYHEAFHSVVHTLLNDSEYETLFNAAKEKYGDKSLEALEEDLAEDFRRYMQIEEMPFVGRVVKIFRTLRHLVQSLLGKESYINGMFYRINSGTYGNREVQSTSISRNRDYIPYQILEEELYQFKQNYAKAVANRYYYEHMYSSSSRSDIDGVILDEGMKDVLYSYYKGEGKYRIAIISKNTYNREVRNMERDIQASKAYGKPLFRRVENNRNLKEDYKELGSAANDYAKIEQYHRDKYELGNLSEEDKQYLEDRKITMEEYKRMSPEEREVLFHCKS